MLYKVLLRLALTLPNQVIANVEGNTQIEGYILIETYPAGIQRSNG